MHHHMMIVARDCCPAAWSWRGPMRAVFSRLTRPQFRVTHPSLIPLVVFGIICNPYTSSTLKLFSDLGDYFRATVVDWTWGLGRTALGGGAFACLKVSLPFNFLACIRATRLGWVEKSRQSPEVSRARETSRFLMSIAHSIMHMHGMHHHMMIDARGQVCPAAWFWRSPCGPSFLASPGRSFA